MDQLTYISTVNKIMSGEIRTNLSPLLRKLWPGYAYHFTDFNNAISILNSGMMYSRQKVIERNLMSHDNASSDVIDRTAENKKNFVRFYHRPKTPTQYHNEGIRSNTTLSYLGSHCPVPVFLRFDLESILMREDSCFTERTIARSENINYYYTPKEYAELPFSQIFHDGPYPQDMTEQIKPYRHAEILVSDKMPVDPHLKQIFVRSPNERTMLLRYLDAAAIKKYKDKIIIDNRKICFYGFWTYFHKVHMEETDVRLEINCGKETSEFDFRIVVKDLSSGNVYSFQDSTWRCVPAFKVNFQRPLQSYQVQVYLNDILVAEDVRFAPSSPDDLPF